MKKNLCIAFTALLAMAFSFAGCAENHYYNSYHHHSPEYYHRHNLPPEPSVNIDVHN